MYKKILFFLALAISLGAHSDAIAKGGKKAPPPPKTLEECKAFAEGGMPGGISWSKSGCSRPETISSGVSIVATYQRECGNYGKLDKDKRGQCNALHGQLIRILLTIYQGFKGDDFVALINKGVEQAKKEARDAEIAQLKAALEKAGGTVPPPPPVAIPAAPVVAAAPAATAEPAAIKPAVANPAAAAPAADAAAAA